MKKGWKNKKIKKCRLQMKNRMIANKKALMIKAQKMN